MDDPLADSRGVPARARPAWQDLLELARRILRYANIRVPRTVFLRKLSQLILGAAECDALDLTRMQDGVLRYHCRAETLPDGNTYFHSRHFRDGEGSAPGFDDGSDPLLAPLRRRVLAGTLPAERPGATTGGSLWIDDLALLRAPAAARRPRDAFRSAALIRFEIEERSCGLLELYSRRPAFFDREAIEFWECLAQFIGIAIADRRARSALCQRVNELTCLNEITQLERNAEIGLDDLLRRCVELLPGAFQFPGRARARIRLDGQEFAAPDFPPSPPTLASPLTVGGALRGGVEIVYRGPEDEQDQDASLTGEQHLLDSLALQISLLIERRQAAVERTRLEEQLRHADRLATIGQLAAGVAHELNEPLANILGFAQLVAQDEALPEQDTRDLGKIINAAMRGREIVKKLLIFSRQMPTQMRPLDLGQAVDEALVFLEARCAREGIALACELAPDLPAIQADPAQIQQVVVNLVVNAIQAMPGGGRLTIGTAVDADGVALRVADTGTGMSEAVRRQAFVPFFTTKDVGQGTGLGLAVVHGIVSAHGGRIAVESREGKGSAFTVTLPLAAPRGVQEES